MKSEIKNLKVKKGISEKGWNIHLPVPLLDNEIVSVHPDQDGVKEHYVRIIHSDGVNVSIFSKSHFEENI